MLKKLTVDDVRDWSDRLGLDIAEADLDEYAKLAGAIIGTIDGVDRAQTRTTTIPVDAPRVDRRLEHVSDAERLRRDPLNAIVRFCSLRAAEPTAGGLLSGKRVVVKDSFAIAGVPMTCGSRVLQGYVPSEDSTVVARLLAAGAEIVGVANMEDMAFSGGGESSFYGPIRNPRDGARISGGSSGGSAAALAYPWVDIGMGTDQGGSVRVPAAYCGVLGLKPTHGLVPYTGGVGIDRTIDFCGPFTRSADELARTMRAISGPDGHDPRQLGLDASGVLAGLDELIDGTANLDLQGLRIGVVGEGFGEAVGTRADVAAAVREALGRLVDLGATLVDVSLPSHLSIGPAAFSMFVEGLVASLASAGGGMGAPGRYSPELATALGRGLATSAGDLSPQVKVTLMIGSMLRERYFHATYAHAMNVRTDARAEVDALLDTVDVLAMPTVPFPAYEIDSSLPLSDWVLRGWSMLSNTAPANMTGHPSITLPTSSVEGLTVGTMLTGRRLADHELVRIAAAYERAHSWDLGADGTLGA